MYITDQTPDMGSFYINMTWFYKICNTFQSWDAYVCIIILLNRQCTPNVKLKLPDIFFGCYFVHLDNTIKTKLLSWIKSLIEIAMF